MASHGGNEMRGCQNQSGTSNSLGAKLNHIGSIVPRDSQFRKKNVCFYSTKDLWLYYCHLYWQCCHIILLPGCIIAIFGGGKKE